MQSINYTERFFDFLGKKNRWIIFATLLLTSAFCIHFWYKYVYNPSWSDEQKKQYSDTREKGVIFDKVKFDSVISYQENRKNEYGRKLENLEDIFRLGERKVK